MNKNINFQKGYINLYCALYFLYGLQISPKLYYLKKNSNLFTVIVLERTSVSNRSKTVVHSPQRAPKNTTRTNVRDPIFRLYHTDRS